MKNKLRTPQQTHARLYKLDKAKIKRFMRKKGLKGEANALRIILKRAKI